MSLGDWLDERTGHRALLARVLDQPVPGGARFAYVWGKALAATLALQAITGVLLMTAYAPSVTAAWSSVAYISFTLRAGWLIRGLHHFGAQALVLLVVAHLAQTALYGAYRKPREVTWYFGIGLLMAILGAGLTGYLLPWDQKGYWHAHVATNILGTVPVVGPWLQRLLQGGSHYGSLTLTRFYTLHVAVLPAGMALLVAGHIALARRHGVTPPAGADLRKVDRLYPKQLARDLVASLAVLLVLFALTLRYHGAPLEAPADPGSDYPARPEWYFLALFQSLKYFRGALEPVGAVGIPLGIFGYLFVLPLLDTKPDRSVRARLGVLSALGLIGLWAGGLTLMALRTDATDEGFQKARKLAEARAVRAIALFEAGVPPDGPLAMLRRDPETRGPELFAASCASCHRLGDLAPADGKDTAPALDGYGTKAWALAVLESPDADARFGKTPFKGGMPSMVHPPADAEAARSFKPMSAGDQDAVATFLDAQGRGESAKGTPGETLVRQRCTGCHRMDGKTDDDDSLAPELRGWGSTAWIEAQIGDPGMGATYPKGAMALDLKGHMPAFGEELSTGDRKVLALWVHRHARKDP